MQAAAPLGAGGLVFEAAETRHSAELVDLFTRTSTPCHCRYWHFAGDKNAWLYRLFHEPEQNRGEFIESLAQPELKGVVALAAGNAVGWMKLCAAAQVPKLYEQRLYKGLACFTGSRVGVLTVGCMLVDDEWRRRGIARGLLRAGIALARAEGARYIEAFPRRSPDLQAPELWLGPVSIFLDAGFEVLNDFAPYPVLRYAVDRAKP